MALTCVDLQVLLGYQHNPVLDKEDTVINPRDKHEVKTWDGMGLIVVRGPPLHEELHRGVALSISKGPELSKDEMNVIDKQRMRYQRAIQKKRERESSLVGTPAASPYK